MPSLAQRGAALVSLRSAVQTGASARAAKFLARRARELNSRVLSAVAERATADPFEKVKKVIKGLVVRLVAEANEVADHKGWCDTELSTNEQARKEKTEGVGALHAEIVQLEASIAKLTEDIADLSKAAAELDAAMAEATTLRAACLSPAPGPTTDHRRALGRLRRPALDIVDSLNPAMAPGTTAAPLAMTTMAAGTNLQW